MKASFDYCKGEYNEEEKQVGDSGQLGNNR